MTEEQMLKKEQFLQPEVRDGYYIDSRMKSVWKVMLDIVEEIVRICDKYNLHYTLAGGSLLGAVRHKGFIPWDDDIDIDMPRPDYDKFIEIVSSKEPLRFPLILQAPFNDLGYASGYVKVRNVQTAAIDPKYAEAYKCCNMGIGVDIFPVDGIPQNRISMAFTKFFARFTTILLARSERLHKCRKIGVWVKFFVSALVCRLIGRKKIWALREWVFRRNRFSHCRVCGEFSFLTSSTKERWSCHVYKSYKTVPFEYLSLKIPEGYEEILTNKYGEWRVPVKAKSYHGVCLYDVNCSYKELLIKEFGYNPQWLKDLP